MEKMCGTLPGWSGEDKNRVLWNINEVKDYEDFLRIKKLKDL